MVVIYKLNKTFGIRSNSFIDTLEPESMDYRSRRPVMHGLQVPGQYR